MNQTKQEFAAVIKEHRILGHILQACYVENCGDFYKISDVLTIDYLNDPSIHLNEHQQKLVTIAEQYSDASLVKTFSKKKLSVQEFYNTLSDDYLQLNIRPYIEVRLKKCIDIVLRGEIRLFLKNTKYENLYSSEFITIEEEPAKTIFNFLKEESGTKYFLSALHKGKEMKLTGQPGMIVVNDPCRLILNNSLYFFEDIDGKKLRPFFDKEAVIVPKTTEAKYYSTFVLNSIKNYQVKTTGFEIGTVNAQREIQLVLEPNLQRNYQLSCYFRYNDKIVTEQLNDRLFVTMQHTNEGTPNENYYFEKTERDFAWESTVKQAISDLGIKPISRISFSLNGDFASTEDQHYQTINWINNNKAALESLGIKLIQKRGASHDYYFGSIKVDMQVKTNQDWFDIHALVEFGDIKIPFIKLKPYILNGIREFKLPNNLVAIIPEAWFTEYRDMLLFCDVIMGHRLKIEKHHFQLINSKESVVAHDIKYVEELSKLSELNNDNGELETPIGVAATLRPYQRQGFTWMETLRKNKLGGCLADDMGLGKTLQTLTLLTKAFIEGAVARQETEVPQQVKQLSLFDLPGDDKLAEKGYTTSMIVMPISLIHNWEREIAKFTPSFKVLKYIGTLRDKELLDSEGLYQYDIVLTSYGIVRNDIDLLKKLRFYYLILDESQYIKNPDSKIYSAVIELLAEHKLVLTGTPIENSLTDLWAQMNFLNEGLLGNLAFFKEQFVYPIEKNNDEIMQQKLQQIIQPFILRRTKHEVAHDLPPVTEQLRYCQMPAEHKEFYEVEKARVRNAIMDLYEEPNTTDKISFLALQGLSTLRQTANHPVLIDRTYADASGKFQEITRHLSAILSEKHKVLIFSSFVKHLNLFEQYFKDNDWLYSKLTGATVNRQRAIDEFQNNPSNQLFLISIKAGGVGLNLTNADYVYIIDPWWNPAIEEQAISRAHRIGQKKNVFVYRFITKDTIEEKIINLQRKKSELAGTFINTNNPFGNLSKEAIVQLFE